MNEASNFCDGICYDSQRPDHPVFAKLRYVPGDRYYPQHAVAIDAMHANGF